MSLIIQDKQLNANSSHHLWLPLISQQLRLRHVCQIFGYNMPSCKNRGLHYTLHLNAKSGPFYTSDIICDENPKWGELKLEDINTLRISSFVLRIWYCDVICLTWGINLSGLVYLGTKLGDLRPELFARNTVIFSMKVGYFTSKEQPRNDLNEALPFIEHMNVLSTESECKVFKLKSSKQSVNEIKTMYNVQKLQKLQVLQLNIEKEKLAVCELRNLLVSKLSPPVIAKEEKEPAVLSDSPIRYAPQLLTMNSLNKMLHKKPTSVQKRQIQIMQKDIETIRLKNKILSDEEKRKNEELRLLKSKLNNLIDDNDEKNLQLMDNYRKISKDLDVFRQWKKTFVRDRENLHNLTKKLQQKRRQLVSDLLLMYPIKNREEKYFIKKVYLPNSNLLLDSSEAGLSVALGYCSHVLIMCSTFLQIPLRYPIRHHGSNSLIEDPILPEKYNVFPLFTKGKDPKQFTNAVYLLNKNIAQYLNDLGFKVQNLKMTLPNLLELLKGKNQQSSSQNASDLQVYSMDFASTELLTDSLSSSSSANKPFFKAKPPLPDPILDSIREEALRKSRPQVKKGHSKSDVTSGFSQIMAIAEDVLSKQISNTAFLSYMKTEDLLSLEKVSILPPHATNQDGDKNNETKSDLSETKPEILIRTNIKSISKHVPSTSFNCDGISISSISANGSNKSLNCSLKNAEAESNGSAQNFKHLATEKASSVKNESLSLRTDALVQRTCFKLVKPRSSSE